MPYGNQICWEEPFAEVHLIDGVKIGHVGVIWGQPDVKLLRNALRQPNLVERTLDWSVAHWWRSRTYKGQPGSGTGQIAYECAIRGVGIAHFNMATQGVAGCKTSEVRPLTAYVLPYFKITCKPMGNFAENLNLGTCPAPPPHVRYGHQNLVRRTPNQECEPLLGSRVFLQWSSGVN